MTAGARARSARTFAALLLACLGACGGGGDAGTVVLHTMTWGDATETAIDAIYLREFERRHPGVRVVEEPVTNQPEYREKVLTSIAAGSPPDVFLLDAIDITAFQKQGVLLDLARFAPRVGVDFRDFYPSILDMFRRDGHVYAFPKGFSPIVIYYDADLFDRAGIPRPRDGWTRADFLRDARALTRDTDGDGQPDQWGFALDRRFFSWQPWLWSGGGDILSPDGHRSSGYLNSPASDSVIAFLASLPTTARVAPPPNAFRAVTGNEVRLFYSGKLGMYTSGHWLLPQLRRYMKEGRLHIGVVSVPRAAGHPTQTVVFASGYAVPYNAPHRKLAVELAAWMAGPYAQRVRLSQGLEMASRPAVQDAYAAHDPYGLEGEFARQLPYGRAPWGTRITQYREVEAQMFDVLDRVIIGHEPVHRVTTDVARRLDGILAR